MNDLGKLIIIVLQVILIGILTYYLFVNFGVVQEEVRHVSTLIRIGGESFLVDGENGNVISLLEGEVK